jgi:hypothetical protein
VARAEGRIKWRFGGGIRQQSRLKKSIGSITSWQRV